MITTDTIHPVYGAAGTEKDGMYSGLVRVQTKTWFGAKLDFVFTLGQPMTKEGVFNVVKGHNGAAIEQGMTITPTSAKQVEEEKAKAAEEKAAADKKAEEQRIADINAAAKQRETKPPTPSPSAA